MTSSVPLVSRCLTTGVSRRPVNHEFQARIVVGLKARIFKAEPALLRVVERFPARNHAADVVCTPPAIEFRAAGAQPRQEIAKGGISGPQVMGGAELRHHAPGLVGP